ncbi:MAG: hypothetical protein HYS81_03805 [Candidatus Aenigmatarchaeota archaeon]|nr:MAG: hypothetical protein HYS81_03805 [Candidatus Aenigmarchaeota archaeon]
MDSMAPGTVVDLLALAEIFIGVTIIAGSWIAVLSWFYETKRMMRWRPYAFTVTIGFSLSMFFNALGMITVVNGLTAWTDLLFNLTVLFMLLSFFGIGMLARDIASLERLGVGLKRLEKVAFTMQPTHEEKEELGIPCVDGLLLEKPTKAPMVLYGEDGTHPWRLGQHFVVTGLLKGESCIYFTATRPPELVIEQLNDALGKRGKKLEDFKDSFAIVDCFTPFAGLSEHETFLLGDDYRKAGWKYAEADPRDLNDIHTAYRDARRLLGFKPDIRTIFDSFSGVIELADPHLLYQYLLHTVTAEEKFRYMSLYIVRKESDLELMRYLVSGAMKVTLKDGERYVEIQKMPARYRSGTYKMTDDDGVVVTGLKKSPA